MTDVTRRLPLVSVVTPTLDQAPFLSDTIDSVLGQDHPSIEYQVVDGGSRDGTLEILARHASRLRFVTIPGERQAAAINRGWRESTGEIVAWLNSDDTYLPGAVSRAVAVFAAQPEVDAVYGECDYVDVAGRRMRPYPARPHDPARLLRTAVNDIPQPTVFLRRRALERVGYLDEALDYAMDLDLWLRMGAAGCALHFLRAKLARLRLHAGAKSLHGLAGFAPELVRIYQRLFERSDLPPQWRALEPVAMSNAHYRAAQCLFWSGRVGEARRHVWRALRCAPFNLRTPLVYAAGGPAAIRLVERWRGNPFRLGVGT